VFIHGCSSSLNLPVVDAAHPSPVVMASMIDGSECFEASNAIPGAPEGAVIDRLEGYLHDAYLVLDTLIVESQDPNQLHLLARMARSLYKAIDASSVLPR